ncbi:hypothetical protein FBQ97_06240 [Acidobacteria bacterium ACD]|nr:MAG: hypothetical protein EDX89_07180 [Acidobacteriota bacterium]MCE7957292.1 hypothetical protein [Acidobacteria bacterium ACB2]MDL1949399.1 hypothetical protein [Acidobacteria bacterium ACD]
MRALLRLDLLALLVAFPLLGGPPAPPAPNPAPPGSPVKLVFVHHSTGENWLTDGNGDLGIALRDASYFVSDTNYGWGPDDVDTGWGTIGDHTDFGNWYSWFSGPNRDTYTAQLFAESEQHSWYSRLDTDPGGENQVVMFKSCFPNSNLTGSPSDPIPPIESNPLRGQDAYSEHMTVANAKGIYRELLNFFGARTDKLFVVVTAPPLGSFDTDAARAANARAFASWLVNDWLDSYPFRNVAVLDFYNVLTSDGGATRTDDPETNDLGWADGNHHRIRSGAIEHTRTVANDFSAYAAGGDSHPTPAGSLKATGELVPLVNAAYNCWKGTGGCPRPGPSFYTVAPCRALDTRESAGPALSPDVPRTVVLAGTCGLPGGTVAVSANLTVLGASGWLAAYPGKGAWSGTSNVNTSGGKVRANNAVLTLAADGSGSVTLLAGTDAPLHVVLDVNGYWR